MKNFILLLAVVVLMSLSFIFHFQIRRKSLIPNQNVLIFSSSLNLCPYSGKSLDRKSENKSDGNCPYLNNGSDKNTSPYLEGMKSSNSNNKNIPQIWQEIKS